MVCAAATGQVEDERLLAILSLLDTDLTRLSAPLSPAAQKFYTAARYGELRASTEKCEQRYSLCSVHC